jgi:hypothetical protein
MAEELQVHSIDEVRAHIKEEVDRQVALEQKKAERWRLAKKIIWLLLLIFAFLQYFFIDVIYEAITLPRTEVNVPVPKNPLPRTGVSVPIPKDPPKTPN